MVLPYLIDLCNLSDLPYLPVNPFNEFFFLREDSLCLTSIGQRPENRVVGPPVLPTEGRRAPRTQCFVGPPQATTAYRRQCHGRNYPVFRTVAYKLLVGGETSLFWRGSLLRCSGKGPPAHLFLRNANSHFLICTHRVDAVLPSAID